LLGLFLFDPSLIQWLSIMCFGTWFLFRIIIKICFKFDLFGFFKKKSLTCLISSNLKALKCDLKKNSLKLLQPVNLLDHIHGNNGLAVGKSCVIACYASLLVYVVIYFGY
jgi:hypothetical protein